MRRQAFRRPSFRVRPVLAFPLVIFVLVFLATALRISGTSVGVYDYVLDDDPSDGLALGQPRTVRSDEWAVNTPFTLSQTQNGFSMYDDNIGTGQDMAVVLDVPYADWSAVFRPQNMPFFILPSEFAFALKWWSLAALLLLAVYFFVLLMYPKRYVMASLISAGFFLSPFIQWWYQSITILPVAYSLIAIVLAYRLTDTEHLKSKLIYGGILAYVLSCFVLVMYPAFQISAALVALVLFVGILAGRNKLPLLRSRHNLAVYGVVLVVVAIVVGAFILQHREAISIIQSTVYPGARDVASGGFDPWMIALWPFSYLLLEGGPLTVFGNNQSEISGFLLFGFCALFVVMVLNRGTASFTRMEKLILAATGIVGLLVAIRLFVPFGSELFALVGMNKVPLVRLMLAIGLINLVLLTVVAGRKADAPGGTWWRDRSVYAAPVILAISVIGVWLIDRHFILSSVGPKEVIGIAFILTFIVVMLSHQDNRIRMAGLTGVVLVSAATSALANPLYVGLPAMDNHFSRAVTSIEKDDGEYWVADDNPILSSLLVSAGAEVIGGVNTYPQSWWGAEFPSQSTTFNRYAHVRFDFSDQSDRPALELIQSDSFRVRLSSCDPLVNRLDIRYVVSDRVNTLDCFEPIRTVTSGQKTVVIFERR